MEKQTTMRDFLPVSKIGEGSFSSVYKVQRITDGCIYALKKVKMGLLSQRERQNATNQIRILASLQNPNIVAYKQAFYEENLNVLCIVMELADGGDVHKLIANHKRTKQQIPQPTIWKAILDMLNGLDHLHSKGILHRDLKSANVFIHQNTYKLGDLNVSKVNKGKLAYTQTGTPYYASPEVWRDQPYNDKSDIWSLGCIIYEMCNLRPPFMGTDMEALYKNIQLARFAPISRTYSRQLSQFVDMCLKKDPRIRRSCKELISHIQTQGKMENNFLVDLLPNSELLKTIQLPQGLKGLQSRLPKSKYNNEKPKELSQIIQVNETPKTPQRQPIKSELSQRVIRLDRPPYSSSQCRAKHNTAVKQNSVPLTAERQRRKSLPRTERSSKDNILRDVSQQLKVQTEETSTKKPSNRLEKSSSAKQPGRSVIIPNHRPTRMTSHKYQQIQKLLNMFDQNYRRLEIMSKRNRPNIIQMPIW